MRRDFIEQDKYIILEMYIVLENCKEGLVSRESPLRLPSIAFLIVFFLSIIKKAFFFPNPYNLN